MTRAALLVAALALTETAAADRAPPRWTKLPIDKWRCTRYLVLSASGEECRGYTSIEVDRDAKGAIVGKETGGIDFLKALPVDYEPLPVSRPQTWLLSVGWRRHGLISVREVPGERARRLVT